MKKIILILFALIGLALASIYMLIPGRIRISTSMTVEANREALMRKLGAGRNWAEWWPGDKNMSDSGTYSLNGIEFRPGYPKVVSVPFSIHAKGFNELSELTLIPLNTDSTAIVVETELPSSADPFKRVQSYLAARKVKRSISAILQSINNTYSRVEALYGYNIQKKSVEDSNLVFTSETMKGYPGYDKIYSMVDELKSYINRHAAKETGYPMLNVFSRDSQDYLVKVAIPVDRRLPDSGTINYRWMLGGGNILITEIKGGQNEISKAYEQILHYISDYQRIAPAIPFESMVTDRRKEPDSSKWITRIYYPVM